MRKSRGKKSDVKRETVTASNIISCKKPKIDNSWLSKPMPITFLNDSFEQFEDIFNDININIRVEKQSKPIPSRVNKLKPLS
jgi:PBP1b-binding outer membrane lipoprotein LpoB